MAKQLVPTCPQPLKDPPRPATDLIRLLARSRESWPFASELTVWPRELAVWPSELTVLPSELTDCPGELAVWPSELIVWPGELAV